MNSEIHLGFVSKSYLEKIALMREFNAFLNHTIIPDYQRNGYEIKKTESYPLKGKNSVPETYWDVQSYKYIFRKGRQIGSSLYITWDPHDLDTIKIQVEKDSKLWYMTCIISVVISTIFLYAITIYFYIYWLVAMVILFVVPCLGDLIAVVLLFLPAVIGMIIGVAVSWILVGIVESKEAKTINSRDSEFLLKFSEYKLKELFTHT